MPEIDENDYAEWQRHKTVLEKIGKSEEAKKLLQKAVLIGAPEMAGVEPRIRDENEQFKGEITSKLDAFLDEQRKDREERQAAEAKGNMEREWLTGRRKLRDAGYSDEGVEKIEAFMEKRGVADHEIAMAAYERENPPPAPVATGGSRWNFFDQRDAGNLGLDALMKGDDEGFLAQALPIALKEGRGG
jgi:hypothetical protein